MSGQFSPTARPLRPGAYFDFVASPPEPVLVNTLGTSAVAFKHSWGPENQIVPLGSFSDFLTFYGQGGTTPPAYTDGYKAVRMAFQGEGLPGKGGAGKVLGYRMVGSGGVASHAALNNTTPAAAITLTARYKGAFGNQITYTVVANAKNPSTQLDLNIFVQGFLTETYTFNKTDITSLGALITANSKWIVPSAITSGTALATVSTPTALASGDDGATLTGSDFTAMQAAFGVTRFGTFAVSDIASTASWSDATGSTAFTALVSWIQGLNTNGKRCMLIVGGSAADTAVTAAARSALCADPNIINIGVGSFTDSVLGTVDTSQLAPRLAGIIAARTEKQGLSMARLAGLTIVSGASDSDIASALTGGAFMTIGQDSNADAPVRFEKGLTTYATFDGARPVAFFSNPKFVLTMQNLENELTEWAESNVTGQLPVTQNTVNFVIGNLTARMKLREADEIIQPGWTVVRNPEPAPQPGDDFIAVLYGVSFIRDVEQVLNTVVVS